MSVLNILLVLASVFLVYELIRRYLLSRGYLPSSAKKEREQTAIHLKKILGPCSICGESTAKHLWHEIISAIEPSDSVVKQIDKDVINHNWLAFVGKFQWSSQLDALVYWFVECPVRSGGTLYRVESRADFDQEDRVERVQSLDADAALMMITFLKREEPLVL